MKTTQLLLRLDEIAASLEQSGHALALIGLGSVGIELDRLDAYSDLDFFVIVESGHKRHYMDNLKWLTKLCPVSFCFANTVDGFKLLYEDGIFCECAIFETEELENIPFAEGRIVWKRSGFDESICKPQVSLQNINPPPSQEWLLGEALSNLYVGMARHKRGEKLSAMRFIQSHVIDRLLELIECSQQAQDMNRDIFSRERRFEFRYPNSGKMLPQWCQGYDKNPESALAILAFLESHFDVNPAMARAIRSFCV